MSPSQLDVSQLLTAQFDASPFFTIITRADDGDIVYVNNVARQRIGAAAGYDNPIGRSVHELGYYSSEQARLDVVQRARQEGGFLRRDEAITGNTKGAHLTGSHVFNLDGDEYLVTVVVDISQVLDTEKALADALVRLEQAQQMARTGDFVTDLDSGEFNGSAEAMRMLGFDSRSHSVDMKELFSHFHVEDRGLVVAAIGEQLPNGSFVVEHRLDPAIGGERWVFTQGTVETDANGRAIVRGTVQDVTERKRDEQERQNLHEKMQEAQRLESLGLLAGGIAHDFNNLLAGILGNADFALLDADLTPELKERLENIISASTRAADLTRQLLAYSGKGKFFIESVDLSEVVREMTDLLKVSISRENSLALVLADDLPAVDVDATQIRQVVMNLILNASEAIEQDTGLVSVTTGVQTCDEAYLRAHGLASEISPGEYAYFEVSDNGVGMDEETVQRVFDPFFTTKFTGRGLGLAAVRGIVSGHQGAIHIRSELGHGTACKVFLPASSAAVKVAGLAQQGVLDSGPALGTVLVIDDDQAVRELVEPVLEHSGYDVLLAQDGVEGRELFAANVDRIELVLLDLTMPILDGRSTFKQLTAIRQGVPTVLMSGYNEQDAMQRFVGKGLAGFLSKPFMVADLLQTVRTHIKSGSVQE